MHLFLKRALAGVALALVATAASAAATFNLGLTTFPGGPQFYVYGYELTANVYPPTRLSLYRVSQTNADQVYKFAPSITDTDLGVAGLRFDFVDAVDDGSPDLLATFTFSGDIVPTIGIHFQDGGDYFEDARLAPFKFLMTGADIVGDFDGPGPPSFTGEIDRLTFLVPGDTGLYYIEAAVPEPATWALLIGGFGLAGAALRRRPSPAAG